MKTQKSIEEKVENYFKTLLDNYKIRRYDKNEMINDSIENALKTAKSKSGKSGGNYPDIKLLLSDTYNRQIPVMIEVKGSKGKLEKLDNSGNIDLKPKSVMSYAVNGALHYANAILDSNSYNEVIAIGVNGTTIDDDKLVYPECKAYYISKNNKFIPKLIDDFDFAELKDISTFYNKLDRLSLTSAEIEKANNDAMNQLELQVKHIHQEIYDANEMKTVLDANGKLYFFVGLIIAGLSISGTSDLSVNDLKGDQNNITNDGIKIMNRIELYLHNINLKQNQIDLMLTTISSSFKTNELWRLRNGGTTIIHDKYAEVKQNIIPIFNKGANADFAGLILNSLSDWVGIANDKQNDVVLTPSYVTKAMARMANTNMNSIVWDSAMGSAGFLTAAESLMIEDAKSKIKDPDKLREKEDNIRTKQLLGVEILPQIYVLAVLNMILLGISSDNVINGDSHDKNIQERARELHPNVYLLNPPYSAEGKGFIFVQEALQEMTNGRACILIQENAGSGQGSNYTKNILKNNTLRASIHMPQDLFCGKAGVQTAIYVFDVNRPHEKDDLVKFIDMSNDGYTRQNRKKSTMRTNLKNTDHATERYDEVVNLVLGKATETNYYTKENGKLIEDTICVDQNSKVMGADWTFNQHKKEDNSVSRDDFKKVTKEYLTFVISNIMGGDK